MHQHQRAKELRKSQTDTEKFLWYRLRSHQLGGHKIRRQHPIGPFIVDFVCLDQRLIIELDGGQHVVDVQRDRQREQYLEAQGYRVLRFWNHEALTETEGVLARILEELKKPPHPALSLRGERE